MRMPQGGSMMQARPMTGMGGATGGMGGAGRRLGMQPVAGRMSYKRGGKVKKTGMARLHKGEQVLTKRQAGKMRKGKRSKSR